MSEVGSSTKAGSTENLLLNLAAGSYYVAVVDYAGVAMRYSMCIRRVPALTLPACPLVAPGPAVAGAPKRISAAGAASPAAESGRHSLFMRRRP